jgi:hypothetical protein
MSRSTAAQALKAAQAAQALKAEQATAQGRVAQGD